jgi:hypothetical protein
MAGLCAAHQPIRDGDDDPGLIEEIEPYRLQSSSRSGWLERENGSKVCAAPNRSACSGRASASLRRTSQV